MDLSLPCWPRDPAPMSCFSIAFNLTMPLFSLPNSEIVEVAFCWHGHWLLPFRPCFCHWWNDLVAFDRLKDLFQTHPCLTPVVCHLLCHFFFPDQACMILHGNVDIDKNCIGLNPCTFSTKILQSPIGEEAYHTENICWTLCQAWGLLSMLMPPLEWGTGIILDYMDQERRTERAFKKCAPRRRSSGSAGPGIKPTLWTRAQ